MLGAAPILMTILAGAQPYWDSANPHIGEAVRQIAALKEETALRTLERARAWPRNGGHDLALVHVLIGLAQAGLANEQKAVASFRTALLLEPGLSAPPGASPRVVEWFRRAGGQPPALEDSPPASAPPERPTKAAAGAAQEEASELGDALPSRQAPGEPLDRSAALPWTRLAGVGLGALAAVCVAGGLVAGLEARSTAERARSEPRIRAATDLQGRAEQSARTANVLYGSAAGLALAGGVLFFW